MGRILIVDDEPDLRGMVRLILELAGHSVTEAHHGRVALERLREVEVDLIITDVMMPMMSGSELINELRSDPSRFHLPIMVLSASPHNVNNADQVMRKPFEPQALREAVSTLLQSRGRG
jgi:CheY-like chemotaxis protein